MLARPRLIQNVDLLLPRLPAALEGLRIAHLTDLHARRPRRRFDHAAALLVNQRVDLVALTGDFMETPADKDGAFHALARICQLLRPRLGAFGVFGNHDTPAFRDLCRNLPVHWLVNRVYRHPELPLHVLGLDTSNSMTTDPVELLLEPRFSDSNHDPPQHSSPPLRLMLSHLPPTLLTASDLGADLMLAGHTHGGQIRPWGRPLANSTHWPLKLTCGIFRHRQTLACVSRGLGETGLASFRFLCPPHVPLYTLRRGNLPGPDTDAVTCLRVW